MVPVDQTIFSGPRSNCFQACLASVLEVPLTSVPNFAECGKDRWFFELAKFLGAWGLGAMMVGFDVAMPVPSGYSFLTIEGASPKSPLHVVVAFDGEVVWDPSPITRKSGKGARRYWTVITVRDPSKPSQGTRGRVTNLPQIFSEI